MQAIAGWEDRRLADPDSLSRMIAGRDAHVRLAAVRAAGLIGREEVLPQLIEALADPSTRVCQEAAFALGILGNAQAVPALSELATSPHSPQRLAALGALAHLEHTGQVFVEPALRGDTREAMLAWDGLRDRAADMSPEDLLATVQAGLSRSEPEVLWRVLRCAEKVADPDLIPQVAPFALSDDAQIRVHALRALGQLGGEQALAAALASGEQKKRWKRHRATRVPVALMRALGRLAPVALAREEGASIDSEAARITTLMTAGASSNDPHLARTALNAMAKAVAELPLPPEAAERESLLPVWRIRMARAARERMTDPVDAVRAAAVEAIFALRGTGAMAAFETAQRDASALMRAAAVSALAEQELSASNMNLLMDICHNSVEEVRVRAAGISSLARMWQRCQEGHLCSEPLRELLAGGAFATLQTLASEDDFVLVSTAAPALGLFPGGPGLETLLDLHRPEPAEGGCDIHLAVLEGLEKMMREQAQMSDLTGLHPEAQAQVEANMPLSEPAVQDSLHTEQTPPPAPDSPMRDKPPAGRPAQLAEGIGESHRKRAAFFLAQSFDATDIRIRLKARSIAKEFELLPANLIPSAASLKATMPAFKRSDRQPPLTLAFEAPRVICQTERGDFIIALEGKHAPNTVVSILALIEAGFYDGLTFHRVVPDFVIQGGDPRGDGWGGPGYTLRSEWNRLPFERGTVGIAHSGKDTGGSQFFVCHSAQPHLNGRYTVCGQVVKGMQVVDAIQPGDSFRLVLARTAKEE